MRQHIRHTRILSNLDAKEVTRMAGTIARFSKEYPEFPIVEFLDHSAFDELISIDLEQDTYRFIFNVEQKYWSPSMEGVYSAFINYVGTRMVHPEDQQLYLDMMDPQRLPIHLEAADDVLDFEFRVRNTSGGWHWCEQYVVSSARHGVPEGAIYCYVFDIQSRKDREEGKTRVSYRREVHCDPLTGLPREKDFYAQAESILADTTTNWLLVAIDLQHFKLFNEWYGRGLGDHVLADIGRELVATAEAHHGVSGYIGGDDFALLVPADRFSVEDLYQKLQDIIKGHGVSIGFLPALGACYSNGSTSIYSLHDEASLACQEAKKDYRNRVVYYSSSLVQQTAEDYRTLSAFKDALAGGEITFFLQPQCRAVNGQIVGAEALARWIKPDGTMIPPFRFVPTLERYGFIPDLDRYIWEAVCKWSRESLDRGNPLIPVSVNISPVDIFTMDVPNYFQSLIEKYSLPRNAIKVEITESAYGEDSDKVRATVQTFRDMGFMVLMDDFGSGFSSLNMLRELNVDMIKLDAYFLRMDEATEKKGMHILESVVNMAKTMSMPIIVEGVETTEQCAYLMSLGCRYIQGYYFYRPMAKDAFQALIADPKKIDPHGFTFKFNEEFHIREFLNDDVYSDSMLNQIIGPAAIYAWHGDVVDIIRFNQQFYKAVNAPDFTDRLLNIQQFMPKNEQVVLLDTLQKAFDDRLNGASGILSFNKVDGTRVRFLIHFYFLNTDGENRRFYGSARDVTDIAFLQQQMQLLSRFVSRTVLFLIAREDKYVFEVVAHGLEKAMGLNRKDMEEELNSGRLYKRLIPKNESVLWKIALKCVDSRQSASREFRMVGASGEELHLVVDADYVDDPMSDVKCILSMRRENGN